MEFVELLDNLYCICYFYVYHCYNIICVVQKFGMGTGRQYVYNNLLYFLKAMQKFEIVGDIPN